MDIIGILISGAYGIFIAGCIVILIFLIIRRRKIRKSEDFEERTN